MKITEIFFQKYKPTDLLGTLLFLVSMVIAFSRSFLQFENTYISWGVDFSLIICCLFYAANKNMFFSKWYFLCSIFLLWAFWGALRGVVFLENYWFAKQWLYGITCVSLPCLAFIFSDPTKTINILKTYNYWLFPTVPLLFIWIIDKDSFHFCFGPVYFLYGIFWIWLPKKWKWWTLIMIIFMVMADTHARAQVIKALLCIMFAIAIALDKHIPSLIVKSVSWIFYAGAIILLTLGISGEFNIFDLGDKNKDTDPIVYKEGQFYGYIPGFREEEALTDTRSFIYIEVISSAINNDYAITGRTLARGNDSVSFGKESMTGLTERYDNELCHLNIFTWLGLIGVFLYAIIYIYASWLAAYRSRNIYISYLGILIAFHWFFGWIEDQNLLNGMNIGLWMIIGLCLSPHFREMTNKEFEYWVKTIFSVNEIDYLSLYKLLKIKSSIIKFRTNNNESYRLK